MKASLLATAAIVAPASATATTSKETYSARHRNAFMNAMRTHHSASNRVSRDQTASPEAFAEEMSGDSTRARKLRKKVLERARPVAPGERRQRRLQNYNNQANNNEANNNQANNNKYNYYANNQATKNSVKNNKYSDDYFMAYGAWSNAFGFDPTQYSLSYHRCATVRQYDDAVAAMEDTDSVFATKRFAVFRFCPSKTCEGIREEPDEDENYQYQQYQYQGAEGQRGAQQQGQEGANYYNGYAAVEEGDMEEENVFDRLQVGGANGEGCQSSYGEYMLKMEDYLAIMTEYHNERFEAYCETCQECMYDVYQQWLEDGGDHRELKDISDPSWEAELESDAFRRAHRELNYNPYTICPEFDTCKYYKNVCNAGVDNSLSQYFECTQVEKSNGRIAYIGPRCSADGITITLGVFADEYCNEYIGDGVSIEKFLGYEVDVDEFTPYVTGSLADVIPASAIQEQNERYSQNYDAELAEYYSPFDNMCIPCMASRQPYESRGNVYDYEDQDGYDNDDINELCLNMYMVSARCDKHYRSYSSKSKRAKYAKAAAMEDLTCDFIDSIVMGNYDENGYLNGENMNIKWYDPDAGVLANSMMWQQYGSKVREVSPLQVFGLVASIAAVVILATWSTSLRASLNTAHKPWRPRMFSMPRKDSGIMVGRSNSDMTTTDYYRTGSFQRSTVPKGGGGRWGLVMRDDDSPRDRI